MLYLNRDGRSAEAVRFGSILLKNSVRSDDHPHDARDSSILRAQQSSGDSETGCREHRRAKIRGKFSRPEFFNRIGRMRAFAVAAPAHDPFHLFI